MSSAAKKKVPFANMPGGRQAIEKISEMADECPFCGSPDIGNQRETDMVLCHDCATQFDMDTCTEQVRVIKALNTMGLSEAADAIKTMTKDEYESFLADNVF